jgi:hypothetical protein
MIVTHRVPQINDRLSGLPGRGRCGQRFCSGPSLRRLIPARTRYLRPVHEFQRLKWARGAFARALKGVT